MSSWFPVQITTEASGAVHVGEVRHWVDQRRAGDAWEHSLSQGRVSSEPTLWTGRALAIVPIANRSRAYL